jgi:hypothetical protein
MQAFHVVFVNDPDQTFEHGGRSFRRFFSNRVGFRADLLSHLALKASYLGLPGPPRDKSQG